MQQMEVTPAHGGSGDLQDDISVFDDSGFGSIDYCIRQYSMTIPLARKEDSGPHTDFDLLLSLPYQSLHCFIRIAYSFVVGYILLEVLFLVADDLFDQVGCLRCHDAVLFDV